MRLYEEDPCGGEHNVEEDAIILSEDNPSIISQHFSELRSMLPDLPPDHHHHHHHHDAIIDEESIIRRTIEHIEQLRHEATLLDERVAANNSVQNQMISGCYNDNDVGIPMVQVMASGKNVLIKIHCKKDKEKDNLPKRIADEIDKFHLSIVDMGSLPFNNHVNITIVTLIGDGYKVELKDLVMGLEAILMLG